MGAWGIGTFENDGAMDWLGGFLEDPSEGVILAAFAAEPVVIRPGFFGRLMGEVPVSRTAELEGDEVVAAAEVVAALAGHPAAVLPYDLRSLPAVVLGQGTVAKALAAVEAVLVSSHLRDCWEETDDFEAWKAGVDELKGRLGAVLGGSV